MPRLRTLLLMGCAAFLLQCGKLVDPDVPRPYLKTWDHPPGDFAPLSTGNVWKYRLAEVASAESTAVMRTWRVIGTSLDTATGDSVFALSVEDTSVVNGQAGVQIDTVWFYFHDNYLRTIWSFESGNGGCQPVGALHVADSTASSPFDINFAKGLKLGTAILGTDTLRVIRYDYQLGGPGFFSHDTRYWGENLGLLKLETASGLSYHASHCVLVEFNGVPVPPLPGR